MRVYRITGQHWERDQVALGWVRTEGQAKSAVKAIKAKAYADAEEWEDIQYQAEDIPTDKAGFCLWLNKWSVHHGFLPEIANVMGVEYDIESILEEFDVEENREEDMGDNTWVHDPDMGASG